MTDEQQVLEAAQRRAEALVAADAVVLCQLMHEHLRWTTFQGDTLDRAAYVEGNTNGTVRWHGQRLDDVEVMVVADTAVLTAIAHDDVERDGAREMFTLHLTQVWIRDGSGWRCLGGHAGPRLHDR